MKIKKDINWLWTGIQDTEIFRNKAEKNSAFYLNISRRGYKCGWTDSTSGELTDIYLSPDVSVACNVWNYQGMEGWNDQSAAVSASIRATCLRGEVPFMLDTTA